MKSFNSSFRRVLVTGGAGAIGSQVACVLLGQGLEVVVVDDESSGWSFLVPDGAVYVKGSIEDDAVLESCFAGDIDAVVHCAAFFANQNSVEHPEKDLAVNGLGTLRLLQKAQARKVAKLLYTSSSCVYGQVSRIEDMVEDSTALELDTPYAISKLLGEQYCRFWSRHHGMNTVMVRLFNNYGPGEMPGRYRNVIPNFFGDALKGKPLVITGDGTDTRDFTFVEDTVHGILSALFADTRPGDVFNIGSGVETAIMDLALAVNHITGNSGGIQHRPCRQWDHVKRRRAMIGKARSLLDYQPRTVLATGLAKTLEWFSNKNILEKLDDEN